MSAAVLRIALRAMAWLVPAAHRARWREEWLAEVEFALSAGGARAGFRLAAGAASDVASLRGLAFRERLRWRGPSWMDVKLGIRMLIRYPGLAIISILSMAVAIAIGALSFTVMYGYMQPGVPLPDGDRLVAIDNWDTGTSEPERHALADVARWRRSVTSIAELGAYRDVRRNLIVPGGQIAPVQLAEITAAGLRMARVPPLLGRLLVDEDERKAAAPVLVIGYELWQTRFAADPWIVGRTVRLGGAVYTIVGVMPPGFAFPVNHAMWAALQENALTVGPRRGPAISIFGRLAPGVTIEDARAEMTAAGQRAAAEFPATHARLRPRVMPFTALYDPISGSEAARWQVHFIQSLFTLILVLVGANVAILVYARTATRMGEIAVRTALGASRARIVTQLFMEAAVLCAIAGTVGVILARVAMRALDTMLLSAGALPFWIRPGLSYGAVVYAGGLALLAALLAGVLPGLQATGARVQSGLRHFGAATGIRLGSTWTALIVAQVAIAVAVLPWIAYQAAVLGPYATFDAGAGAAGLLVARLAMDTDSHASSNGSAQPRDQDFIYTARQTELTSRLEREPGVSDVTFSLSPPGDERTAWVEIEGLGTPSDEPLDFAVRSGRPGHQVRMTRVGVNYFAALGVRILGPCVRGC